MKISRKNSLPKISTDEKVIPVAMESKKRVIGRRTSEAVEESASISSKINKKAILIAFLIVIFAGLLYYFKNQFIVASVNGQPIWRLTLISELEKQSGKRTLDAIVTKTLVFQEAKKQKVTVSDEEIKQEIKNLEDNVKQQGQNLDELLREQGMIREALKEQIRLQKLVEKLAGKEIIVTDQEVNDYLEKNKSFFPQDSKIDELEKQVKERLKQQKLSEKIQSFIKSLRDNAKINYF